MTNLKPWSILQNQKLNISALVTFSLCQLRGPGDGVRCSMTSVQRSTAPPCPPRPEPGQELGKEGTKEEVQELPTIQAAATGYRELQVTASRP